LNRNGKVIIFYAWGTKNPGDHALALGALYWLTTMISQDEIVIVNRYESDDIEGNPRESISKLFPRIKIVSGPFRFSRKTIISRVLQYVNGAIFAFTCILFPKLSLLFFNQEDSIKELAKSRIVLLNGGNLFYWHRVRRAPARLLAFAFPLVMARRLNIPYGFLPQTCGPFEGRICWIIGKIFKNAKFVLFRDKQSYLNLSKIENLDNIPTSVVPDLAFYLNINEVKKQQFEVKQKVISVVLRVDPLGPDVGILRDNPEESLKKLVILLPPALEEIKKMTRAEIVFIIQVESDEKVTIAVHNQLREKYKIHSKILTFKDPCEFCDFYEKSEFVISMRLHSIIFALSRSVPVISIWRKELGMKIPSMMEDLDLSTYCLELSSSNPTHIVNSAIQICNNRSKISQKIFNTLTERKKDAREFIENFVRRRIEMGSVQSNKIE
jgi:polysaccharide pyruvyl transferase WcaK-like protein